MTLLAATTTTSSAKSPFSGSRLISDGQALSTAMKNGDWLDGGIAFLQGLGDLASAATDPIGTLVNCGLGWVMGHLAPLSTWLNQLAGSKESVLGVANQWTSTGATMRTAGTTLATRLKDLDGMQGQTVSSYLAFAKDAAVHLHASGDWADAVSQGLTDASSMVEKMQSVVKKAISSVIATAIEAMAVVAATWGLGIGYAIARVVAKVNEMVNKVVKPILQVLTSVKSLVTMVQSFHQLFDGTNTLVSNMLDAQPSITSLDPSSIIDATGATFLGNTAQADLSAAGLDADGRIHDLVTADGPIASGTVNFEGLGTGAGGATGAANLGATALGGAGGSVNGTTAAAGSMLGGTAMSAARVAGVSTGTGGAGGSTMMAPGRTAAAGAEGMGARSSRRGKRLTVQVVPTEDDAQEA